MCKSGLSAPHSVDTVNNSIVSTTRVLAAEFSVVEIRLSESLRSTHVHFSNQQVAGYSSVLIETVNYFVRGGSNVYGCFLDASKAFDKVHYGKLFSLLMSKGLPNVVVRFVLDGYIRQSACIQWEGVKSRSFNTFNGVKQGGVISPILFSIYYDELITRLSSSRYGCRLSGKFVGALAYADDITLLCPSLHGLQEMVNIYALILELIIM